MTPLTDSVDRFEELESVVLDGVQSRRVAVESVRVHKNQLIMKLSTIESRNDAEAAVGSYLSVTRAELISLPDDTLFQFEIIGMKVVTEAGEELGQVTRVVEMPANDIWRVEGKHAFDLPATGNIVVAVDKEARTITIRIIEGLLDLNR